MSVPAYPLQWPDHIERSRSRESGKFKTSLSTALKNVEDSVRRFAQDSGKKITGMVISSNYSLGVSRPQDPGVAVWFVWDDMQVCIPVDRYTTVESNLQAIFHVVEARRTELRHGTLALVRASFRGFLALPAPAESHWSEVLGVSRSATREQIEDAHRALAKKHHPDAGGDADMMAKINAAKATALEERT